jgi:hypothetical protein
MGVKRGIWHKPDSAVAVRYELRMYEQFVNRRGRVVAENVSAVFVPKPPEKINKPWVYSAAQQGVLYPGDFAVGYLPKIEWGGVRRKRKASARSRARR